jgi:hypothetical protein
MNSFRNLWSLRSLVCCLLGGAVLTAVLGTVGHAAEPAPLTLQTPSGTLSVDAKGISLAPSIADCPAVRANGQPMWKLTLQKEARPPITDKPIVLTDLSQAVKREKLADGIRLSWTQLVDAKDPKRTWHVGLTLDIRRCGDAFQVTGTIKNDEPGWLVAGFSGPWFNGVQVDLATHPALLPQGFGTRVDRLPQGKGKMGQWRQRGSLFQVAAYYPSAGGTMQWCALAGTQGGLYLGGHDATHGTKAFALLYNPQSQQFALTVEHRLFCAAGKQWAVPPTVLRPYRGTWHAAARYYRAWVDRAVPVRQVPAWARDASGWLLCILKQQNGEVLWNYPSLVKLADVADQRGIDILGLFGWAHGGHDHLYPDYIPDAKMGGEAALRQALKEVRRRGKRSIIYANGQLEERDTEFWRTQGRALAVIKQDGISAQERWHKYRNAPYYQFDLGCLATQGWYDRMLSLALQANDLGADGILFDQLGGGGPMACYAEGHGHPVPSLVYEADRVRLLRRIADHMSAINPDFIVMTEGLHDSVADSISLFHGCVRGVFAPDIPARAQGGLASGLYPELFRYTYPEVMSTIRIPTPMMNRLVANYICTFGFRYEIESRYAPDVRYLREDRVPETSEYAEVLSPPDIPMMQATPPTAATRYLKQVIEFQRSHRDLLWRGRFTDDEGFTFQGPGLVAKSYQAGDRLGVLVWNPTEQPARFTLTVPKAKLVSAAEPECPSVDATSALAPQSVRLLVWKRQ